MSDWFFKFIKSKPAKTTKERDGLYLELKRIRKMAWEEYNELLREHEKTRVEIQNIEKSFKKILETRDYAISQHLFIVKNKIEELASIFEKKVTEINEGSKKAL